MRSSGGRLVLCYHAVSAEGRDHLLVSQHELRRQLAFLVRRGYHFASADEVLTREGKLAHVTFDDAFVNVLDALPVLEEFGARATVFACSGLADDGSPPLPLRGPREPVPGAFATLGWEGLAELVERGVAVASHTVSHPHLPELDSSELDDELVSSRERLEDELGVPCRFLAYPFGENDARVRAAARSAGYDYAFGLPGDRSWSDPYNVPRTGVWQKDGMLRFALKTSTALRNGRGLGLKLDPPLETASATETATAARGGV